MEEQNVIKEQNRVKEQFEFKIKKSNHQGINYFKSMMRKKNKYSFWKTLDYWFGNKNILTGYSDFRVIVNNSYRGSFTRQDATEMIERAEWQLTNGIVIHKLGFFPVETAQFTRRYNVLLKIIDLTYPDESPRI